MIGLKEYSDNKLDTKHSIISDDSNSTDTKSFEETLLGESVKDEGGIDDREEGLCAVILK